ncbi:putative ribonuclease H-like domain-containing protein [Tanacetum coccineum]
MLLQSCHFSSKIIEDGNSFKPVARTTTNADGLETNSDARQARKENVPDQEYILLPVLHTSSNVPSNSKKDESPPKDDAGKMNEVRDSTKDGSMNGPGEAINTDRTNRLNTISSQFNIVSSPFNIVSLPFNTVSSPLNTVGSKVNIDTADLQDTSIFGSAYDDEYVGAEADLNNLETNMNVSPIPITKIHKDHPKAQIIGEMEPKKVTQALDDESLVEAIQEELLQFKLLNVWTLVELPHGKKVIGTKWVFRNKRDQRGLKQSVYKVEKALYGLHHAPRAWYETLSTYLMENRFRRGTIDKTLFIKKIKNDILLVQVYVDDIIFGSTKESLSTEFEQLMHKRFQMSSMRELTFFLGLQVKQRKDGIFLSQDKYVYDILKKFGFSKVKTTSTPMETHKPLLQDTAGIDVDVQPKASHMHAVKRIFRYLKGQPTLGLWYPKDSPMDLIAYSDSDYAGASIDRKSTTRFFWLQNQLLDYGYNFMKTKIHVDNESAICVVKNPVNHLKTKHIKIRHHFIRDTYEKKLIEMVKILTDYNVVDFLTKAFDVTRFQFLIASIAYSDSDYAGASIDRKSTTGGCQFLGCRLILWQCKKQAIVANSTTEA